MENKSGVDPVEYRVLIKPDSVGGTIKLANGKELHIPDESQDREAAAQVKGTLISHGDNAFEHMSVAERAKLRPGTRVYYAKYQGIVVKGADGEEYRMCNDKDISAIIYQEAAGASTLAGRKPGALGNVA